MEKYFGYQIWKPTDDYVREAIKKQIEINNVFINQPLNKYNYKLVSEEILDTEKHYELKDSAPGYSATIWDFAKNYRKFKEHWQNFKFEIGDAIVIYHTFKAGEKTAPCILIVGDYFYGWSEDEFKLLRDYEPVQQDWEKAINSTPVPSFEE